MGDTTRDSPYSVSAPGVALLSSHYVVQMQMPGGGPTWCPTGQIGLGSLAVQVAGCLARTAVTRPPGVALPRLARKDPQWTTLMDPNLRTPHIPLQARASVEAH